MHSEPRRPIRILELRSVWGTGGGPEKTILCGAAQADPRRYAITVCYLRDGRDTVFEIDVRAAKQLVDYVEIHERHSFDTRVWPELREIVRTRQIDIVHSHDYKTDFLGWFLSKAEGVIALSTAHAWTGHSWRERNIYYPANKRMLARFGHVIAVSSEIKRELIRYGADPHRVDVVLNGIDDKRFRRDPNRRDAARRRFGLSEAETVIGAVGRLEPQKRFDLLLEAIADIGARYRVALLIAGDGSLREALTDRIKKLNLVDRCRLIGHCGDVIEFHHALDLFVQSSEYEGTPNVVLEAMALETPIVATDVGGSSELVRADIDGVIVPPRNVVALKDGIDGVLSDRRLTLQRMKNARERVEADLSFARRMAKVEAIYDRLAQNLLTGAAASSLGAQHA